jgi:hypothetical protein
VSALADAAARAPPSDVRRCGYCRNLVGLVNQSLTPGVGVTDTTVRGGAASACQPSTHRNKRKAGAGAEPALSETARLTAALAASTQESTRTTTARAKVETSERSWYRASKMVAKYKKEGFRCTVTHCCTLFYRRIFTR